MPKGLNKAKLLSTDFKKNKYLDELRECLSKKGPDRSPNPVTSALEKVGISREAVRLWRTSDSDFREKESRIRNTIRVSRHGMSRKCLFCGSSFAVDFPSSKKKCCSFRCSVSSRSTHPEITKAIIKDHESGVIYKDIASKYGVNWVTVFRIINRHKKRKELNNFKDT